MKHGICLSCHNEHGAFKVYASVYKLNLSQDDVSVNACSSKAYSIFS